MQSQYEDLFRFPLGKKDTRFFKITDNYVSGIRAGGVNMLEVDPQGLALLAETAFRNVNHLFRTSHLKQLAAIIDDPESSDNDRYVAYEMLKNAVIASDFVFPMCQDTGTAIVFAKKGACVHTPGDDAKALIQGIHAAYSKNNLRYSQVAPLSMYAEKNTGCNLPAQVEIHSVPGESYEFLFIAKGGGSANKTFLFQETKAILKPSALLPFIEKKMRLLGTAACPPYHLAVVVGGTSAEMCLKVVKLASAGALDELPQTGNENGRPFRDHELEADILEASRRLGIGAQFGGKYFCHDVRVIRLPRHGASCPIGIGVSCSADRNILGKITREGIFLEQLETDPARFLPSARDTGPPPVFIDLNRPMDEIRAELSQHPVATRLALSGPMIVARDIAHARILEGMEKGQGIPEYFRNHIIYYAGPAKTPKGHASGSFGPTTAARMDPYIPLFQEKGACLVTLAKGNRSRRVVDSCKKYKGFYLGSIGGPAARLGKECITSVEILDFEDLGMEAVYKIEVKDFPAFILIDDKGNDFFKGLIY